MQLTVPVVNNGEGSLANLSSQFGTATECFDVSVRVGDRMLAADPRAPRVIKIDVEGFECQVLSGLKETLHLHRPVVITEVNDGHLVRANHSPKELFDLMTERRYSGHSLQLNDSRFRRRPRLDPATPSSFTENVVWIPSEKLPEVQQMIL